MEPMKPMKPMAPMKPMEKWWPADLGEPTTTGGQNDLRYAFFPDKKRLLVDDGGTITTYDSGDRDIGGVQQASGAGGPTFTGKNGSVTLDDLKVVE